MRSTASSCESPSWSLAALVIAAILAVQIAGLWALGRLAIAKSGTIELWHGTPDSGQSQHLLDWYSLSHVTHGLIFYLVLLFLFPRASVAARLIAAFLIEGAWELFENTDFIINRYRQSNLAQGYMGDTIVNSVMDSLAMGVGFLAASRLTVRGTVLAIVVIEILLAVFLRDNLTLNTLNLIHPFDVIQEWQAGGSLAPK